MTNKALHMKKREIYKAFESYRRALTIDKNDTFAAFLSKSTRNAGCSKGHRTKEENGSSY